MAIAQKQIYYIECECCGIVRRVEVENNDMAFQAAEEHGWVRKQFKTREPHEFCSEECAGIYLAGLLVRDYTELATLSPKMLEGFRKYLDAIQIDKQEYEGRAYMEVANRLVSYKRKGE